MDDILDYLIFEDAMLKNGQKNMACPSCYEIIEIPENTKAFYCIYCGKKIILNSSNTIVK